MTKDKVRKLTDKDLKLQWCASVLFSEISELVESHKKGFQPAELFPLITFKVEEFEKLVVQRMGEVLEEKDPIEERVRKLEERVFKNEV